MAHEWLLTYTLSDLKIYRSTDPQIYRSDRNVRWAPAVTHSPELLVHGMKWEKLKPTFVVVAILVEKIYNFYFHFISPPFNLQSGAKHSQVLLIIGVHWGLRGYLALLHSCTLFPRECLTCTSGSFLHKLGVILKVHVAFALCFAIMCITCTLSTSVRI